MDKFDTNGQIYFYIYHLYIFFILHAFGIKNSAKLMCWRIGMFSVNGWKLMKFLIILQEAYIYTSSLCHSTYRWTLYFVSNTGFYHTKSNIQLLAKTEAPGQQLLLIKLSVIKYNSM